MDLMNPTPVTPRSVEAGQGLAWWTEAWTLFTRNPGMWIVLGLIVIVLMFLLGLVPVLGGVAAAVLFPVLAGGWLLTIRKAESGQPMEVNDLFSAFKQPLLTPLATLGGITLLGALAIGLAVGALGAGAALGMVFGGMRHSMGGVMAAAGTGMLAGLVALVMGSLLSMALWFAPALVVFKGLAPMDAVKASFAASLKNIVPFLLFSLIYLVAAFIASLPAMLGWVVLAPLLGLAMYASYRDVFAG